MDAVQEQHVEHDVEQLLFPEDDFRHDVVQRHDVHVCAQHLYPLPHVELVTFAAEVRRWSSLEQDGRDVRVQVEQEVISQHQKGFTSMAVTVRSTSTYLATRIKSGTTAANMTGIAMIQQRRKMERVMQAGTEL